MSSNERPGMAMNEDEVERHVNETREQAKRANYPDRPTPLHAKAKPTATKTSNRDAERRSPARRTTQRGR
jgi:hypothetical protein